MNTSKNKILTLPILAIISICLQSNFSQAQNTKMKIAGYTDLHDFDDGIDFEFSKENLKDQDPESSSSGGSSSQNNPISKNNNNNNNKSVMTGDEVLDRLRQYTSSNSLNSSSSNNSSNNNKRKRPIKRYRKRPRVVSDDVIGYYMDQKRRYYNSIRNNNYKINNNNKEPRQLSASFNNNNNYNNLSDSWTPTKKQLNKKIGESDPFKKIEKQENDNINNINSSNNNKSFIKKESNIAQADPFQKKLEVEENNNIITTNNNYLEEKEEKIWKPAISNKKSSKKHKKKNIKKAEQIENMIPDNLKRIVKDSGSRIINKVLHTKRQDFGQDRIGLGDKLRTMFYGSVYPAFAPEHVTAHLVAQWINVLAITFAWLALGGMYSTTAASGGRSFNGDTEELDDDYDEVWQDLIPDSHQVAAILREVASAADRWSHDEL